MWIITALEGILQEVCGKGLGRCCMYSVIGVTGDMLKNGSDEDGRVRGECEEEEGTDCEDGDRH